MGKLGKRIIIKAEKISVNGGFKKNTNLASFVGAFPIHEPKYLVLAMVMDPKKIKKTYYNNTGGWVAAPLVRRIITEMIKILNIAPTQDIDLLNAKIQEINLNKKNVII